MSDDGSKKTVRASDEFWNEYAEWASENDYESLSHAVRDGLEKHMYGDLVNLEKMNQGLRTYLAGLLAEDEEIAFAGGEQLYEIDEELGEYAAHHIVQFKEKYWG